MAAKQMGHPQSTRLSETATLTKRARTVISLYLTVVMIYLVALSGFFVRTKDPWSIGDWLINYQGGFVRRGLLGECALQLSPLSHTSPMTVIVALQLAFYFMLLLTVWLLVQESGWAFWVKAFVVSPATLAFPLLDFRGAFRKDEMYLAGLATLLVLLRHPLRSSWVTGLYVAGLTALLALSHEALLVFLPYCWAVVAMSMRNLKKSALVTAPAVAVALLCCVAVTTHHGNAYQAKRICASLGEDQTGLCSGAVGSLAQSTGEAHRQVTEMIHKVHPIAMYAGLTLLGALPCVLALARFWRQGSRRWEVRVLLAASLVAMSFTGVLFAYTLDWGRWIYLHLFSLFLLCLFLDGRMTGSCSSRPARTPWLGYVFLMLYATCWDLPAMDRTRPPYGYVSILQLVARQR